MACHHARTREGERYAFTGSVCGPRGEENRAAHGCVTYTETCVSCGAERGINVNQVHYEYGEWGPSASERRRAILSKPSWQRGPIALYTLQAGDRGVEVERRVAGKSETIAWITWWELDVASRQDDRMLSEAYSAVRRDALVLDGAR